MEEKIITTTEEHLNEIIKSKVEEAMKNRGIPQKAKRVTESIATVRFHNDKLVIWYGNHFEELDARNKLVGYMDIKLDGEEELVRVNHLNFLNTAPKYNVLIKKVTIVEQVKVDDPNRTGGTFTTVNPDEGHLERKNFNPRVEVAEVRRKNKESDIEVLEGPFKGQTYHVIDNDVLNK